MQKMIPVLTDRQHYWLEHIQACEASGKSIAEYAADTGIWCPGHVCRQEFTGEERRVACHAATPVPACTGNGSNPQQPVADRFTQRCVGSLCR